jgi:hypothetical protein
MATYYQKYYLEFQDAHANTPATWRVDILDSEGSIDVNPIPLQGVGDCLITERIDTEENKFTSIIGRQITITYKYGGLPNEPLPTEFFEASERRFKVEVRKNGVLDGVYWVKPDFCTYPYHPTPFAVQIKAVDGMSFAAGVLFNMDNGGLLKYEKINLYEALLTRGLFQCIEPNTPVNVLCTLYPTNIEPGEKMLFGEFVHTDIFYDFVEGANSVRSAAIKIATAFTARMFMAKGELWFIRTQDLDLPSFTVDRYTDSTTVTAVSVPDMLISAGPAFSHDMIPVNLDGVISPKRAVKKASFETQYQGINILTNSFWENFTGSDFTDWYRAAGTPSLFRTGSGTTIDPYRAIIPYDTVLTHNISQGWMGTPEVYVQPGDIIEIEFPYEFFNTKRFGYLIDLDSQTSDYRGWEMTSGGQWISDGAGITFTNRVEVTRSGRKQKGSIKVKSDPIPAMQPVGSPGSPPLDSYRMVILIWPPDQFSDTPDGPFVDSVHIYPLKLAIIKSSSKGRHVRATNDAEFSQVLPQQDFTFIDMGDPGISNTIFTGAPQEPAEGWQTSKAGSIERDIEDHMARAHVEQYARSILSFAGSVYSNQFEFYSVIEFQHIPGKRFMQFRDTYNNRTCVHQIGIMEILPEEGGNIVVDQWDIEEEKS